MHRATRAASNMAMEFADFSSLLPVGRRTETQRKKSFETEKGEDEAYAGPLAVTVGTYVRSAPCEKTPPLHRKRYQGLEGLAKRGQPFVKRPGFRNF